jgi:hypothetical protein
MKNISHIALITTLAAVGCGTERSSTTDPNVDALPLSATASRAGLVVSQDALFRLNAGMDASAARQLLESRLTSLIHALEARDARRTMSALAEAERGLVTVQETPENSADLAAIHLALADIRESVQR